MWVESRTQESRWTHLRDLAPPPSDMVLAGERALRHRKLKVRALEGGEISCLDYEEGEVPLLLWRRKPHYYCWLYETSNRVHS